VADVTTLDRIGVPVYQAVRPASLNLSVSQGKGASPDAARASAAMEAFELWHAEDLSHLPQATLSFREARYANPIPLESLRWSPNLPPPAGLRLPWVSARSLSHERQGWLPRAMLELDFRLGPEIAPAPFRRTSNGLASGNCREEALLHALCELVERHALSLAEEDAGRRVPVIEDSVEAPGCRELIGRIRTAGMKLAVRDITCELGLPAFRVDLAAPDLPRTWRGAGCHTCPAVALSRALTEAAQSRLTVIAGSRDDVRESPAGEPSFQFFEEFLEPQGGRAFPDVPDLSTASVAADVDRVVERLAGCGLEAFWVDLTRPEIGIPVVFAFIPGLREPIH
jgi:ribosomal protein S12 methylthiotransferase accessory factor